MIRLLYITPNFTTGGTEGQVFALAAGLDRSRFTPYVISVGADGGQRIRYGDSGIDAQRFEFSGFSAILSYIRARKIDLVHSFYYGDFSGWDLMVSRLAGAKVFVTSRRNMGYWRKGRHIVFDRFRNFFTDMIIANSDAVRAKAVADEHIMPSKTAVIYNGIDPSRYAASAPDIRARTRTALGITAGEAVVGMVGNVKKIKGYGYFLEAAKIMADTGRGIRFIIAGEGTDGQDLRGMIDRNGLGAHLLALGPCGDIPALLSAMDVFMCSSLSEGFPNVILEAMAAGVPVVSTDVGGIREMLEDGRCGVLVPPRDSRALADAAMALLDDTARSGRIASAAQKTIRARFTMDACVRQHESLYEDLILRHTGRKGTSA